MRFLSLSIVSLSTFVTLVDCGGLADSANGQPGAVAPGSTAPTDALSCTSEPRLTELAKESRPALPQIVTDGAFAYWARRGAGQAVEEQVVRAPLAGGPIEVLVTGAQVEGIAVDDGHVYWTERASSNTGDPRIVARVPKTGGAPEVIVSREALLRTSSGAAGFGVTVLEPSRIAIDGDALLFGTRVDGGPAGGSRYGLFRTAKQPKAPNVRAEILALTSNEHSSPLALVLDDTSVYWVADVYSGREPDERRPASLRMTDKRIGGDAKVLAEGPTFQPKERDVRFGLAIDGANLYWLSQHDGAVMKIAKSGGAPIVLAGDEKDFKSIAVGGGFVYWTWMPDNTSELGGVRRVATTGGPVTTVAKDIWLMGLAYDPKGLVVSGSELSRVTTCP